MDDQIPVSYLNMLYWKILYIHHLLEISRSGSGFHHCLLLSSCLGGIQLCAGTLFQAIGKPAMATVVSLAKQVIFYIPAMLVLALIMGLDDILWAGPLSELLAFFLGGGLMLHELRKMTMERLEENQ